jgi:hypothetical protein
MALIVTVHGIGKQVEGEFTLGWSGALRSGVALAGGPELRDDDIKSAFYGSLFRRRFAKGFGDPAYTAVDVQDCDEVELLEAWWAAAAIAEPEIAAPADKGAKGRTPGSVQKALNAVSRSRFFAGVAEQLMIADVKQVALYMRDDALRAEIQARVREAIAPDTKVVVAHSLGSVVAYEVLAAASADLGVTTLVTLGSPLGIPNVIFDRLAPPPQNGQGAWPPCLDRWHNVADPGDVVALVKELSPLFGGDVTDWLVHNGAKAHDAKPYLTAEETGRAIASGLGS